MSARRVARVEDIPSDHPMLVEVDGLKLALARVGDAVYAIDWGNVVPSPMELTVPQRYARPDGGAR